MKRFAAICLSLLLFGCSTGPTFFSESHLAAMAASEFARMKQEMPISRDPQANAMVQRVSQRIAATVGDEVESANWEFVVFDDNSANAFAMPGGKIAVFTGILKIASTDDELAAVIGHEIAHVQLQHANQRMSAEVLRMAGGVVAVIGTRNMEESKRNQILAAYGLGTQVGIMLPYSRSHELQADRQGLLIAARSGYDPRAAITFWQKMERAGGSSVPEFLSTHPSGATRIRDLQAAMPEALALYRPRP